MRRKALLLFIILIFLSCNDTEFSHYQPANPPVGLKLIKYNEDHILIFRSENISNSRFGGFLIFIESDSDMLLQSIDFESMDPSDQTSFIDSAKYSLNGAGYNLGIETDIVIIFSDDAAYDTGSIDIDTGDEVYTVTTRLSKDEVVVNSYLTARTYLVDEDGVKISISSPGNLVQFEP